jgi:chromosome segregation ATPase
MYEYRGRRTVITADAGPKAKVVVTFTWAASFATLAVIARWLLVASSVVVTGAEVAKRIDKSGQGGSTDAQTAARAETAKAEAETEIARAKTAEANAETEIARAKTAEANAETEIARAKTAEANAEARVQSAEQHQRDAEVRAQTAEQGKQDAEVRAQTAEQHRPDPNAQTQHDAPAIHPAGGHEIANTVEHIALGVMVVAFIVAVTVMGVNGYNKAQEEKRRRQEKKERRRRGY